MTDIVPTKSNRQRALDAMQRIVSPAADRSGSSSAAAAISSTVVDSLKSVAAYSAGGRRLDLELSVAHRGADGSETAIQVRVRY
jgi:hypothetical protein